MPASDALIPAERTFAAFPPIVAVTGATGVDGTPGVAAEPFASTGWTAPCPVILTRSVSLGRAGLDHQTTDPSGFRARSPLWSVSTYLGASVSSVICAVAMRTPEGSNSSSG
jgi:hypothetical protein